MARYFVVSHNGVSPWPDTRERVDTKIGQYDGGISLKGLNHQIREYGAVGQVVDISEAGGSFTAFEVGPNGQRLQLTSEPYRSEADALKAAARELKGFAYPIDGDMVVRDGRVARSDAIKA